jgi:putative transcriptional regulator
MSKLLENIIETAADLHKAGVMNEITLREFDALALPKIKHYSAEEIKRIRLKNGVSQPVFAAYLNASTSTVKQWEQDKKHPQGTALKLINIVEQQGIEALA